MRYFKAYWDEPAPGPSETWGGSWWFFELGPDNYPVRQAMLFDGGELLLYDQGHMDDDYGGLGDQAIDVAEGPFETIDNADFDAVWDMARARNRAS